MEMIQPINGNPKCNVRYKFDHIIVEKNLVQEYRQIETGTFNLHFYKSSRTQMRETYVYKDSAYIQMHFELSDGYTTYLPKHQPKTAIKTQSNKCTMFYLPQLDGQLQDPVCKNALSFEVELNEQWLTSNLLDTSKSSDRFLKQLSNKEIAILGEKSCFITSEMKQIIYEINTCHYEGLVKQLFVEGKVMLLMSLLLHQIESSKVLSKDEVIGKGDLDKFYYLRELLTLEYQMKHTIEELALRIGMNRTKLQAGFKQCFGITIHDYLIDIRMEEAYKLLYSAPKGSYSIVEIATQVGYKHYNHFSTMFKKKFGVSPSAFM